MTAKQLFGDDLLLGLLHTTWLRNTIRVTGALGASLRQELRGSGLFGLFLCLSIKRPRYVPILRFYRCRISGNPWRSNHQTAPRASRLEASELQRIPPGGALGWEETCHFWISDHHGDMEIIERKNWKIKKNCAWTASSLGFRPSQCWESCQSASKSLHVLSFLPRM
jgi:hypothetical protein